MISPWFVATITFAAVAVLSFIPVAVKLLRRTRLLPGGPSFAESEHFSDDAKVRLDQNFQRLKGTLTFWKTQAARYHAFHRYCLVWVAVSTVSVPFLAQAVSDDAWSRWFLTIVGGLAALLLTLSRTFRVEKNYQAFRHGESEFYDLYRRLLDRPETFGADEGEQLSIYFEQVEGLRRFIRSAEIDNLPSIEEVAANGDKTK